MPFESFCILIRFFFRKELDIIWVWGGKYFFDKVLFWLILCHSSCLFDPWSSGTWKYVSFFSCLLPDHQLTWYFFPFSIAISLLREIYQLLVSFLTNMKPLCLISKVVYLLEAYFYDSLLFHFNYLQISALCSLEIFFVGR